MKTIHVCTYCGSPRVFNDAQVSMNDPSFIRHFDNTDCENCEGECCTTQVEVPDDFDMEGGFACLT